MSTHRLRPPVLAAATLLTAAVAAPLAVALFVALMLAESGSRGWGLMPSGFIGGALWGAFASAPWAWSKRSWKALVGGTAVAAVLGMCAGVLSATL